MRAIGYFRLVNEDDKQQGERLREDFQLYCERYLHQPVAIFGDEDVNPNGGDDGRHRLPEYTRMLEYILNQKSNFLVVLPDTTHLGSGLEEVVRMVIEIEATGCKVTCDDDDLPDPLQNALNMVEATGVSKMRSERIKESMRKRAILGKGLGKPPYGYRNVPNSALEVVEEEAAIVRLIYDKYTGEGLGLRLIAQYLNEQGLKTRRGGRWNMVTLRDILRNPTYTGTYTRFGLRLPKVHEAIISAQIFRAAQDQTKSRRPSSRSANAEPFLLSGLAYCGYCDNRMMGVTRRQSWRRKNGQSARGVYRYYQCQTRNNQSLCGYHTWRAPALEAAALSQLRDVIDSTASVNGKHVGVAQRSNSVQAMWDKRVKNAERRFLLNLKRAARGEFGLGAVQEHLKQLDKARINAVKWDRQWNVEETLLRWDALAFEEQQAFLMMHISKIVVHDDGVEVLQ